MRKFTFVLALAIAASLSASRQAQAVLATFADYTSRAPTAGELTSDATLAGKTIYEFFVTTDSDILSVNQVTVDGTLYQNAFGTDNEPPSGAVLGLVPAAAADSWITTPGATAIAAGGGFATPNSTWFDSSTEGPQANFKFAQLTTADTDWTFVGRISLAVPGGDPMPFAFSFAAIPEPSTVAMGAMGLIGVVATSLRRRMKKA